MVLSLAVPLALRLSSSFTSSHPSGTNLGPTVPPSWLRVRPIHHFACCAVVKSHCVVAASQLSASHLPIPVAQKGTHGGVAPGLGRCVEGGGTGGAGVAHTADDIQSALPRPGPFVACAAFSPPAAMHAELVSVQVQLCHE